MSAIFYPTTFCDLECCSQILQQLQLHVVAHLAFVLQSTNCEPGIQNNILPSSIEQPWWLVDGAQYKIYI